MAKRIMLALFGPLHDVTDRRCDPGAAGAIPHAFKATVGVIGARLTGTQEPVGRSRSRSRAF
jgi:hypothetical protein